MGATGRSLTLVARPTKSGRAYRLAVMTSEFVAAVPSESNGIEPILAGVPPTLAYALADAALGEVYTGEQVDALRAELEARRTMIDPELPGVLEVSFAPEADAPDYSVPVSDSVGPRLVDMPVPISRLWPAGYKHGRLRPVRFFVEHDDNGFHLVVREDPNPVWRATRWIVPVEDAAGASGRTWRKSTPSRAEAAKFLRAIVSALLLDKETRVLVFPERIRELMPERLIKRFACEVSETGPSA